MTPSSKLSPILAALVGGGLGFGYYELVGCVTGTCWVTSHPAVSAAYFATVGFFLGGGARWVHAALRVSWRES